MGNTEIKKAILNDYFNLIEKEAFKAYKIAEAARSKGFDPTEKVEIEIANNAAERVQKLVSFRVPSLAGTDLSERIRKYEEKYGWLDWRVSLKIAEDVAFGEFCDWKNEVEGIDAGIRTGLAYITLGVVSAPIEGIIGVKIKRRMDRGNYLAIYYGGPIRTAGGTASAFSVLIADYLRKKFGISEYDPTEDEIQRYIIEIEMYHSSQRLQYKPAPEEIKYLVTHIPIEVTGDGTLEKEVLAKKDLPRVETNLVRGGMCLVLGEGLAQKLKKFKKIEKWAKDWGLEHWVKISKEFSELQKKIHSGVENTSSGIAPNYRYLEELVTGRPILSLPMKVGGFRIRYGRARNTGLAAVGVHPATMEILGFLGIGTQIAIERPGKAAAVSPVDTIEGPIVKLKDGSVVRVESLAFARKIKSEIKEVLFLGDILIAFGEFLRNGHILIPSGYVEEWWAQEVRRALKEKKIDENLKEKIKKILRNPLRNKPDAKLALEISKELQVPLHPKYTYFWENISSSDIIYLFEKLKKGSWEGDVLRLKYDKKLKKILEKICIPHRVNDSEIIIEEDSIILKEFLDYYLKKEEIKGKDGLEALKSFVKIPLRKKSGIYLGARIGRPEKSALRKLKGRPHMLFPVGSEGGRMRNFMEAVKQGSITGEFPMFFCRKCSRWTIYPKCEKCNSRTIRYYTCRICGKKVRSTVHCGYNCLVTEKRKINPGEYLSIALKNLGLESPSLLKGVKGMSSLEKIPERIEKGILRAFHKLYVNKDGTIRFDAIELPLTHFRPKEIGVSVEKLRELGYKFDIYGKPLVSEDQIVELFPQDIILPDPNVRGKEEKSAAEVFFRVANFIDDLLEKLYGLPRYYNLRRKEDLIGHLCIALAPHTSAGTVCRIIGFSKTQTIIAHPYLHAAERRNCDGDELGLILLLDGLLNFSRKFLPKKRGATQDAPLVICTKIDPRYVDDEVYNMEVVDSYPLEFFELTQELVDPKTVLEKGLIEIVEQRIGNSNQFFDLKFTHDTEDINKGIRISAYKELNTMEEKLNESLKIAQLLRSVDERYAALLTIKAHFMKDVKGNYRKFFSQVFRCVNCNEKYERPPLSGKCRKCGGRIILTVPEGGVKKYLDFIVRLAQKYHFDTYEMQEILLLKERIDSLFGQEYKLIGFLNNNKCETKTSN